MTVRSIMSPAARPPNRGPASRPSILILDPSIAVVDLRHDGAKYLPPIRGSNAEFEGRNRGVHY
jgi:hypothetical protein